MSEDDIIAQALQILQSRVRSKTPLSSPSAVRDYLTIKLAHVECEVFWAAYLDTQHNVIELVEEFRGTLDATSVYPREVVKSALRYNAAAVLFCHNHPSGNLEPSYSDIRLTKTLKEALALVGTRVLDHFTVAEGRFCSMAEKGLI